MMKEKLTQNLELTGFHSKKSKKLRITILHFSDAYDVAFIGVGNEHRGLSSNSGQH